MSNFVTFDKAISTYPARASRITPDGHYVYVANQGTETNPDNTVSVVDTATQKVINKIKVRKGPNGITFRSASR